MTHVTIAITSWEALCLECLVDQELDRHQGRDQYRQRLAMLRELMRNLTRQVVD
jgi:hypothetical protein